MTMIEFLRVYMHDQYDPVSAGQALSALAREPIASHPNTPWSKLPALRLVHNVRGGKSGCVIASRYVWRMGLDWMPDIEVRFARYFDPRKA